MYAVVYMQLLLLLKSQILKVKIIFCIMQYAIHRAARHLILIPEHTFKDNFHIQSQSTKQTQTF